MEIFKDFQRKTQAWKSGKNDCFITASFPSLIKDGNSNLVPQIHLHNTNAFFEDLTGKYFYNLAYKLLFLHTDLPMLHKQACFSTTIFAIIDLSRILSFAVCYKKINNAMVKFVVFSQQPSSHDLCVNIVHIRSKTFCSVRKCIKFVKVSFQVLINCYTLFLNAKVIKNISKKDLLNKEKKFTF